MVEGVPDVLRPLLDQVVIMDEVLSSIGAQEDAQRALTRTPALLDEQR